MEFVIFNNKEYFVINFRLQLIGAGITDISQISNIRNLKTLRFLELQRNKISKICGLETLSSLQTLNLSYNEISEISGLEKLEKLEKLDLSNNKLKFITELEHLKNLKKLELSSNEIEEIGGLDILTKLELLRLGNNKIIKISGLDSLLSLKDLYLNNNKIEVIENISHLRSLGLIDLSSNPITEIAGFQNLSNLKNIRINNTNIPKEVFDKLGGFKYDFEFRVKEPQNFIKFCNGDYVEYKGEFIYSNNNHLKLINLNIEDIYDIKHLSELTSLEILELRGNKIKEIHGLESLVNLKKLYLSSNQIENIDNLKFFENLNILALHHNLITEINGLENLKNLKHINLSGNKITKISGLENQLNIRELALSINNINKIENIHMLKNLYQLHLDDNSLDEIQGLGNLTSLKKLYLQKNKITNIKELERLRDLEVLNLSHNLINKIENLKFCSNLIELNLSNNKISKIEELEDLITLNNINLENNAIDPEIIEILKFTDNDPKLFVCYCILEPILGEIKGNKVWLDLINEYPYLNNINYDQLSQIALRVRYLEIQVHNNNEIEALVTPEYLTIELDKLLEQLPDNEDLSFTFITNKLKLINEKHAKKLCQYVLSNNLSKFPLYESENGIRKIGIQQLTHQLAIYDTLNQRYFLKVKEKLFQNRIPQIENFIISQKKINSQIYKYAFINDEILHQNRAPLNFLEKDAGWHLIFFSKGEKKTDIDAKLLSFVNDINNLYSREWDKIYLITSDRGLINSFLDTFKISPQTEIYFITEPNDDLLKFKPNLKKYEEHDFDLNVYHRV